MASLNVETGANVSFEDYGISLKIIHAWDNSDKATQKMLSEMSPAARENYEMVLEMKANG